MFSPLSAEAAEIPTLGDDSAYSYVTGSSDSKDFTTYGVKTENQDVTYTDAEGTQKTVSYEVKTAEPEYVKLEYKNVYLKDVSQGGTNFKTTDNRKSYSYQTISSALKEHFVGIREWWARPGHYGNNNYGGAMYLDNAHLDSIIADYIGNNTYYDYSQGGAIYQIYSSIDSIEGDFIGNYAFTNNIADRGYFAKGGAISNDNSTIGSITGKFVENYVQGSTSYTFGGAIYNDNNSTIKNISADFIGNYVLVAGGDNGEVKAEKDTKVGGGAIYNRNNSTIGNLDNSAEPAIKGNFVRNYVNNTNENFIEGETTATTGGAIFNDGTIGDIEANFVENHVLGNKGNTEGGAIYNLRKIGNIKGVFSGNFAKENSSATGEWIYTQAGAIYNNGGGASIGEITADFTNNYAQSENKDAKGGAIFNGDNAVIAKIKGFFGGNHVETANGPKAHGGAITNMSGAKIENLEDSMFVNNSAKGGNDAKGGAIYNESSLGSAEEGIVNTSFIANSAEGKEAKGGAIYTNTDLKITAKDGGVSEFVNNNVTDTQGTRNEAIYADNAATVTLNAKTDGKILLSDKINGSEGYKVNITGDATGKVFVNNDILSSVITLENTNLYLGRDDVLNTSSLTLNSGVLSMINNQVGILNPTSLTLNGDTQFYADVNLAEETMDRIKTDSYGEHQGNLVVSGMNLLTDIKKGESSVDIYFAENGLKDYVVNAVGELPDSNQTIAYSPIYKYNVKYDNRDDGGYFVFNRVGGGSGSGSNPSESFNPAVLATPVAAQVGGLSAINETLHHSFMHLDRFSQMPSAERIAIQNNNKYAIQDVNPVYSELTNPADTGYWVKPYTTFEKVDLSKGPDVDAITYGTMIGFDGDLHEMKNGWYNVRSVYAGYNGSSLSYKGVDTTMNGGVAGITETFYKDNFFTAVTASAGASVGTNSTMYGNEDFTMLLAGVASKTGYSFEFKNGKYVLQPLLYMGYSFINTFDYTNKAGVSIDSEPMHNLQVNPSVKFVANTKNGWQPYASVGFVWNVLNSSKVAANNVVLPRMSVDPFVEYGVGVQKTWKDRATGFAQAMVRNGGRNGVALTFGFRWALGKDKEDL
ncbi:MAG: hypothetical protein NC334_07835 [Bacteroides sp.]|nr:hypothetical protein [Bacteroides sp.]